MSAKGKMESLSRFNFILLKQTKYYSFSPIVPHILVALRRMEYLSGPVAVAALNIHILSTEITFPTRNHTMQYFIFQNPFFHDFTGFSEENFHLISVRDFSPYISRENAAVHGCYKYFNIYQAIPNFLA